jgi:hypothetical protein
MSKKSDIQMIIRCNRVFIALHTLLFALITSTIIIGFKNGEIHTFGKSVLILGERIKQGIDLTLNEPTPKVTVPSARWRDELNNTPTPTVIRKAIIVQPKIIITVKPQPASQINTDEWFKKAQEENAAKAAQSASQLQQFQLKSQQDMKNFSQQAQQGMTDFQKQSDADMQAFKDKYGL